MQYILVCKRNIKVYFTEIDALCINNVFVINYIDLIGRWLNGKPHGSGKLEWSDGRTYIGQFHKGVLHGTGKMEIPMHGIYEGQWKDGQQNGYGTMK